MPKQGTLVKKPCGYCGILVLHQQAAAHLPFWSSKRYQRELQGILMSAWQNDGTDQTLQPLTRLVRFKKHTEIVHPVRVTFDPFGGQDVLDPSNPSLHGLNKDVAASAGG